MLIEVCPQSLLLFIPGNSQDQKIGSLAETLVQRFHFWEGRYTGLTPGGPKIDEHHPTFQYHRLAVKIQLMDGWGLVAYLQTLGARPDMRVIAATEVE